MKLIGKVLRWAFLLSVVVSFAFGTLVQAKEPTVKLVEPEDGKGVINHPKCKAEGRTVTIKIQISDLETGMILFPCVMGVNSYYVKQEFQKAGHFYQSDDGYGYAGNDAEQKETVFFLVASGKDIDFLRAHLGGKEIKEMPKSVVQMSNPFVTVKIRKAGDCK